ncbi:hypothetical protein [Shewanella sp. GXUN23E]
MDRDCFQDKCERELQARSDTGMGFRSFVYGFISGILLVAMTWFMV